MPEPADGIGAVGAASASGLTKRTPTTSTISASRISPTSAPSGAFFMKPARSSAKSTSSIMTTNRNSTATAPT